MDLKSMNLMSWMVVHTERLHGVGVGIHAPADLLLNCPVHVVHLFGLLYCTAVWIA